MSARITEQLAPCPICDAPVVVVVLVERVAGSTIRVGIDVDDVSAHMRRVHEIDDADERLDRVLAVLAAELRRPS